MNEMQLPEGIENSKKTLSRKNYWSLDVAKFFCALLIISAHFATEWGKFPTIIDYGFSLYIIAVPFFFCCSGFLFFKKLNSLETKESKRKYFIQYEKRLWIMYGLWSAVYFVHVLYSWITGGGITLRKILSFVHMALVIQTYSTIWFLPALAIGVAITYFLVTKLTKKQVLIISVLLYVFGMFGYTYKFVVDGTPVGDFYDFYLVIFKTTRNGLFNAVPFIFMGYLISLKEIKASVKGFFKFAVFAGVFLVLTVAEAFFLKLKFNVTGMDVCIFVVPFTYFFIMAVMQINLKENKVWLWCRKLSLLIFVTQRLFLTVLPSFFPSVFAVIYSNSYIGLVAVIGMTTAFSVVFILLSDKIKFLKKMI